MGIFSPTPGFGHGALYTYKRVLEKGEWVMRRVPATGDLPEGSPLFDRFSPPFKNAAYTDLLPGGGASISENVNEILDRVRPPMKSGPEVYVIRSDQPNGLVDALLPRLRDYKRRGFSWVLEAMENNGPSNVVITNRELGQSFAFYFKTQESLAKWSMGENTKPERIVRRFTKMENSLSINATEDVKIPPVDDVVDFVLTGKDRPDGAVGFGRMVELD